MKKTLLKAFLLGLLTIPFSTWAFPTSWDYASGILQPLWAQRSAEVKVSYLTATSTTNASTFVDLTVTGTLTGDLTGNADTATALAANGANCSAGNVPLGVNASGAVENCFDVWTEAENTAAAYIADITAENLSDLADVDTTGATAGNILYLTSAGSWVDVSTSSFAFQTDLHDAVTLAGEDFLSLATQQITANAINPDNLASADFGDFTCNGTSCSLDATYANSLDTAYNGGVSITADSGPVAITVPNTSNTSALTITQNDTTNNPFGFEVTNAGTGSEMRLTRTNASFQGPRFELYHDSVSPANTDIVGDFTFSANDAGAAKREIAKIETVYTSAASANFFADLILSTAQSGAVTQFLLMDASANTLETGFGTGAATIQSSGNHDLILQTGNGTTGNITITDGANGNITLTPNGSGNVVCGSVCQLFASTNPTTASAGDIALDTTDNQLIVDNGTNDMVYRGEDVIFKVTVASTSVEFKSGGVIPIPPEKDGFELTQFRCYVDGGTSVVLNVSDGTNDTETITCATTLTSDTDVATNDTFTAGELAELQFGTITGSPDYVSFTAYGYWTRE